MQLPEKVKINEISPRDGLQNIKQFIPTEKKLQLIALLQDAGASNIEATAFVNPKWVPQMADAELILKSIERKRTRFSVLIPNVKGFDRAFSCGADEVVAFFSASEIHNKNNVNKSVEDSLKDMADIAAAARKEGIPLRVNIATAFGYQPEEIITPETILDIAVKLESFGYSGITLCDTTGVANPKQVYELCSTVQKSLSHAALAVHFHKAHGIEYANIAASLYAGIKIFESAVGGLGGCPFAPDASGNIATEYLVEMLSKMGINTGFSYEKLLECAAIAQAIQRDYS